MFTENDNLRNEYLSLFKDVQKDIPFARIALEKEPDAINLWVGNSRSVTALHRDPMENIYVQIIGQKHFVLLSPLCQPCVNEEMMWPATYEKTDDGLFLQFEESIGGDQSLPLVPLATWDPDDNHNNKAFIPREARYTHLAKPMLVTLNPGDMLYLPAMWRVQSASKKYAPGPNFHSFQGITKLRNHAQKMARASSLLSITGQFKSPLFQLF